MPLSLKAKLTILAFSISVLFLTLFIVFSSLISKKKLTDDAVRNMQQLSATIARDVEQVIHGSMLNAILIAQNDRLVIGKASEIVAYFSEVLEFNPIMVDLNVLNLEGLFIAGIGGQTQTDKPFSKIPPPLKKIFRQAIYGEQGEVYISERLITEHGPSIVFFLPITNKSNTIVVRILQVVISLKYLENQVDTLGFVDLGDASVYLMDKNARVIATKFLMNKHNNKKQFQELLFQINKQIPLSEQIYIERDKYAIMAAYARVDSFGENQALDWTVVSTIPYKKVLEPIYKLQSFMIKLGGLVTIFALFIAYFLARHITMPLDALTKFANQVSISGNYGQQLEITTRDETEIVANAFNQMLAKIEVQYTQLQLAKDEAEHSNNSKTTFFTNMSHELRTPLHGILSYSELGIKKVEKSEISRKKLRKYFDNINTSANRLLFLLNELLDLAKLESGKMIMDVNYASLRKIAVDVVTEQQARLDDKNIKLNWDKEDCNTHTFFDSTRIAQVIGNLLSNAIKFTPKNGNIWIRFKQSTDAQYHQNNVLQFIIRDSGNGLPDNELEQVFEKFVQSSNNELVIGSSGLGLAICKEIIQAHTGHIWAENFETGGAVFTFELPLQSLGS